LQTALDNERNISVAVGVTMMQYRLARQAAFDQLRRAARSRNMRMADLASEVVRLCETTMGGGT
jgi:response regulator NasT